jgi:threonine synthase
MTATACACGCGEEVKPGKTWRPGHNARVHPNRPTKTLNGLCPDCGKKIPDDVVTKYRCSNCRTKERRARVQRAIDILGRACVRCGITEPLHLDHVNDDAGERNKTASGKYRRVMNAEQAEITKIIKTGRSDRLQLLCPNCNHLKAHNRAEYDKPPTYGPLRGKM